MDRATSSDASFDLDIGYEDDMDSYDFDDYELYESYESYSLAPETEQIIVDTCIMVQYTIIFAIVIGLSYALYRLFKIFF